MFVCLKYLVKNISGKIIYRIDIFNYLLIIKI